MTRRRWIADEVSGNRAALTGEHANHLSRVLRARVGQEFDISVGDIVRRGVIAAVSDDRVEFDLGEEIAVAVAVRLTLLLSIFKFDCMEWAIEKCTELGVARIIPVIARRTDTHLASAAAKRVDRWKKIALQAAEQSRRNALPEIDAPVKLASAVSIEGSLRVVLSESEEQMLLREALPSNVGDLTLAIGPEGGWANDELQLFHKHGWIPASLGATILRAETAAIAATAIAISQLT